MGQRSKYDKLIQSPIWRGIRNKVLQLTPLCTDCNIVGIDKCATEVHHITPVEHGITESEMRTLCYSPSNLVALCHECHQERHRQLKSRSKESIKEGNKRATISFMKRFFE